jgi:endonuclease/exonuclease/phosphatase family metal-dependent hydrolase
MRNATIFAIVAMAATSLYCDTAPATAAEPAPITVMTFNVRCDVASDGPNRWSERKEMVRDLIHRVAADFVGMQEPMDNQMAYLREQLPEYGCLVRSREVDPKAGEACPLLYRAERWRLDPDEHGFFWMSETPATPGSRSWNTAYPRITTWGRFLDKNTGQAIYVFNTHLDHRSEPARQNGAKLLAKRIAERKHDDPVLVTGDFNCRESSVALQWLTGKTPDAPVKLVDTFRAIHPDAKDDGTFHGFSGKTEGGKIDFVLGSSSLKVLAAEILRDKQDGRYPTDHFPVMAEVRLERSLTTE